MRQNDARVQGDAGYIILTNRKGEPVAETLVEATDLDRVLAFGRWRKGHGGYVYTTLSNPENGKCRDISLHRFIMDAPRDMVVDHINHNTLDNRRQNLRVITKAENMQNRCGPVTGKRDPYRNVYRQSKGNGFVVRARGQYFGAYSTLEEANEAAISARREVMQYSTL